MANLTFKNLTSDEKVQRFLRDELCYMFDELIGRKTWQDSVWVLVFMIPAYFLVRGLKWLVVYSKNWYTDRRQTTILSDAFRSTITFKHGKRSTKSSAEEKSRNTEVFLGDVPGRSNP